MLKSIINHFKNRKNPDYIQPDFEIEIKFSLTDIVLFAIIIFLIYKFV